MGENNNIIEELIDKQLSGLLSSEEYTYLRQWYNASPENKKQYEEYCILRKYLHVLNSKKRFRPSVESAYKRFVVRIGTISREHRTFSLYKTLRYAAILLLVFGLGATTFYFFQSHYIQTQLTQTIEIPFGSKSKIVLPDGTTVWLNSGSILSYENNFGKNNRDVKLSGEGYFEVTKNRNLPFKVFSGKVQVEVLGTKFNFKSYSDDESAKVTLVEGSLNVGIEDKKQEVHLIPNQQAIFDKAKKDMKVKNVKADLYAMWTLLKEEPIDKKQINVDKVLAKTENPNITLRNTLFFDEESLIQIVRDLERVFNVQIEIKDEKLKSEKFYGDFRNEETLYDILKMMAESNNLHYVVDNNKIVISRK